MRSFATNFEPESTCGKCFFTFSRNCVAVPLSPVASVLIPVPRQPRQSARPDAALGAAPSPAAEPSTGKDYQLNVMPNGANPLILLICPARWRPGSAPRRAADVNREGGMNGQRALVPVRLGSLFTGPAANPIKQQKGANKEWEHAVESVAHRM